MSRLKLLCLLNDKTMAFLTRAAKASACCYYGTKVGNSRMVNVNESAYLPEKWVKEWFLNMKRKSEVEGPDKPTPRSHLRNWNYEAELCAFQERLGINCPDKLLRVAFCGDLELSGNEDVEVTDDAEASDNSELAAAGKQFAEAFVSHYVNIALPALPVEGKQAVESFLMELSLFTELANNLGYRDLFRSNFFPPPDDALANCFLAVLQVINMSEGPVSAGRFLLDFVVPRLHGEDILDDIWRPNDPMKYLSEEMKKRGKPLPDARLSKQSGINTVLPVFYVALFSGEEFLAESGGESVFLAESDAAKLALKRLYKTQPNAAALPMGVNMNDEFLKILFEPLLAYKNAFELNDRTVNKLS